MTLVNLRKCTAYFSPFYVFFINEVDATTQFEKKSALMNVRDSFVGY